MRFEFGREPISSNITHLFMYHTDLCSAQYPLLMEKREIQLICQVAGLRCAAFAGMEVQCEGAVRRCRDELQCGGAG